MSIIIFIIKLDKTKIYHSDDKSSVEEIIMVIKLNITNEWRLVDGGGGGLVVF